MSYAVLRNKKVELVDDVVTWAKFFDKKDRILAKTDVSPDVHVSTVFLGLDHGFGGKPLWFETMIFGGEHDDYQKRYSTWEEAETGHEYAVIMAGGRVVPNTFLKELRNI